MRNYVPTFKASYFSDPWLSRLSLVLLEYITSVITAFPLPSTLQKDYEKFREEKNKRKIVKILLFNYDKVIHILCTHLVYLLFWVSLYLNQQLIVSSHQIREWHKQTNRQTTDRQTTDWLTDWQDNYYNLLMLGCCVLKLKTLKV